MKTRHLVFVTTVLLWFSTFATADRVVVGTTLTPCCPGGADFILPGDFLAQSFVLNQTTYVTSISFTTALYNIPPNPDGATPIDYPTLTFQMQLTNAIGFGAMQSNVLATKEFTMPSNSTSTVLSFSVDMTLPRGTYYLVASTQTPIPNASRVVGWGIAANYFPNTGPELVAFEGVSIWDAVNGICPWVTCSTNVNFPPASSFIPNGGPATPTPHQFQVCSAGGTGCEVNGAGGAQSPPLGPPWIRAISTQGSGSSCNTDQCDDNTYAIKIGPDDNVYVAGRFSGTIQFESTTFTSAGGLDFFLAKYTPTGKLLWVVQAGGPGNDWANGLDFDKDGNVYLAGGFNDTAVFGSTDGKAKTVTSTTAVLFLAKYTPAGTVVWIQTGTGTCVSPFGDGVNSASGVAVDRATGMAYIIIVSGGDVTFTSANGTSNTVPGVCDWHMVLAKFDTNGNFQWGQVNASTINSIPDGIAVDDKHHAIYVTGWFEDTGTFFSNNGKDITLVGLSPAQTTADFPDDCFLVKYDEKGNAEWAVDIGGYKCNGSSVAVSHSGDEVTMVGYFGNINYGSPGEEQTIVTSRPPGKNVILADGLFTDPYNKNGLVVTYSTAGVLRRVRRAGGAMQEVTTGVAYDCKDNLYVSGVYSGRDPQNLVVRKYSGWTLLWEQRAENAGAWVGNNTIISPALAVDGKGTVFVTGAYQGNAQFGKIKLNGTGAADIFLAELAPD